MTRQFDRFIEEHKFDRILTLDLLQSLSAEELRWSPGPNVGPFWKQFRHVGRVQENYMRALHTGTVNFDNVGSFVGTSDCAALIDYLEELDDQLISSLAHMDESTVIDWFGNEKISAFDHLLRMLGHETLHHGQWIVYCRLMDKQFPKSWHIWGL